MQKNHFACFFIQKDKNACYIGKNYANWANHATIEVQTDGEKTMNFTILDLEWNGTYDPKQAKYINEIIQFGAVKGSDSFQSIERFNQLVRPSVGKKLNETVEKLTNISADDLKKGVSFLNAFQSFCHWFGQNDILMTWGSCDIRALIENYKIHTSRIDLPFKCRYLDLQAYCQKKLEQPLSKQLGLSAAADMLRIDYTQMELHQALDDSILALRCLEKLYDPQQIEQMAVAVNHAFFEKMIFKTTMLTDLQNPLVDQTQMFFRCPDCNKRMKRITKWAIKNKQFYPDLFTTLSNILMNTSTNIGSCPCICNVDSDGG